MGFDGFLIDFIQGPEEILSVLCQRSGIFNIPVTTQDLSNHEEIQSYKEISKYICGKIFYSIKRAYGSVSTRSSKIRTSRLLTQSSKNKY